MDTPPRACQDCPFAHRERLKMGERTVKKVIRGGTVVTASESVQADVLVDGETIVGVGSFEGVDAEPIDASGCYVLPGLIDNHTHLSMPFGGTWSIDDYDTGTQAAAAGGTTCLVDFALQVHPGGLRSSLEEWQGRAEGCAHVDYGFHMAITNADEGAIADMPAMVDEGISTFKVFLAYKDVLMVTDDQFLAVLEQTGETGGLVMVHAENGHAIDHLVRKALAAGNTDPIHHALTRPKQLEAEATGRAIRLAEYAGRPVFIVHVTCREAAEEIIAARARGVPAYGETCLQYLFFEQDDLARPDFEGARYVCSPPLRTKADQAFLWDALAYDHLQLVSTDHCPFNDEQKRLGLHDFSKIPNGLAVIQHRLPMLWEHGVRTGRLSMNRLVDITSTTVAKVFGLYPRKGSIAPGFDADMVIFDPNRSFTFGTDTSLMNVDYDVFDGQTVAGSPRTTLCRGTVVYDDGRILTKPGHGRFTKRSLFEAAVHGEPAPRETTTAS